MTGNIDYCLRERLLLEHDRAMHSVDFGCGYCRYYVVCELVERG